MALRRSRVRIPLGPLLRATGTAGRSYAIMGKIIYRSQDRSSKSSRQREGKARWKPFNGMVREYQLRPNSPVARKRDLDGELK